MNFINHITLIGRDGNSTRIIYNRLSKKYKVNVIIEGKSPILKIIKYRINKMGYFKVMGQLIFILYSKIFMRLKSKKLINKLFIKYNLDSSPIPRSNIYYVNSVNSNACIKYLSSLSSKYIIVSGTRIISKKVLNAVNKIFLNIHVGITPNYRGVHGAYWALVNNDMQNLGVTLHIIDSGIDSGKVIAQKLIEISEHDNFITYPYIQLTKGIGLLENYLDNHFLNKNYSFEIITDFKNSNQFYHPTIWFYMYNYFFKSIK